MVGEKSKLFSSLPGVFWYLSRASLALNMRLMCLSVDEADTLLKKAMHSGNERF